MTVLLTRRAVIQAAVETTYNTPAAVGLGDGILCSAPTYTSDPAVLERDFTRDTLSPLAHIIGRMTAKMEFTTELKGNGRMNSGSLADQPEISRLFAACGYVLTGFPAAWAGTPFVSTDQSVSPDLAAVAAGVLTNTDVIQYRIACDTPGASGTARVTISSDTTGESSASQVVTSGSPLTVGTKGLTITPTWTGNLVAGGFLVIWVYPPGISHDPISTGFQSVSLYMYKDSTMHTMPGAFGTFEITAEAGKYATIKWTFWGTYLAPVDSVLPSPKYARTLPSIIELARLNIDGFSAICTKFSVNWGNTVEIREDVNSPQGYIGTRITNRKPEGGIDPEADLVANQDFWGKLRNANRMAFQARAGKVAGNTIWLHAPSAQYTKMTYGDRNGIMTYDAGLSFSAYQSDDELKLYFC